MTNTINLIALHAVSTDQNHENALKILPENDVLTMQAQVAQAQQTGQAIELTFPAFTDGRAFSQAVQLRKRLKFSGVIIATGDVLVDQLVQMQRSGFSSAVLREDQSAEHGLKLLKHYSAFYQGDVANEPAFKTGKLA